MKKKIYFYTEMIGCNNWYAEKNALPLQRILQHT